LQSPGGSAPRQCPKPGESAPRHCPLPGPKIKKFPVSPLVVNINIFPLTKAPPLYKS
jgi:hypothetical protein